MSNEYLPTAYINTLKRNENILAFTIAGLNSSLGTPCYWVDSIGSHDFPASGDKLGFFYSSDFGGTFSFYLTDYSAASHQYQSLGVRKVD
jgi:hypothetical protein